MGYTQRDVANNLLISLSGSFQTSPTFWLNPKNGVSYPIATQTPQYRVDSLQDLENIPVTGAGGNGQPQILGSLASISRGTGMAVVSHYDIQPVIDILRLGAGPRPGRRGAATSTRSSMTPAEGVAARLAADRARTDQDHALVLSSGCWAGWCSPSCWFTC